MAYENLRLNCKNRAFHVLGLFSLVLLMHRVDATEFKVGGPNGWAVPTSYNDTTYQQWAENKRFQVGDTLLFVYQKEKESVLQVSKEHYDSCSTAAPIATFGDGNTSFKLNRSGPFYFISGTQDYCLKNQKLVVVVLSDRSSSSPPPPKTTTGSPPPPPSNSGSGDVVPSPAPAGDESPSPPSPTQPNGASSIFVSIISSVGVFVGSSVLLIM